METLATHADPAKRAEIANRLLSLAQQVLAPTWLQQHREPEAPVGAGAGIAPPREQLAPRSNAEQTEHLVRLFEAMAHVPTPEIADLALSVASDGSAPLHRRVAGLRLLDRVSGDLDPSRVPAREAARADLDRLTRPEANEPLQLFHAVASMRPHFYSCFQEQLRRTPGAAYSGNVQFTLSAAGKVDRIHVEGMPPEMARCIEHVIATCHFAPPGRQQIPKVPLKFASPSAGPNADTCLPLEAAPVALRGVIERRDYPGPPNYQSVQAGDHQGTAWVLRLDPPICTQPSNHDTEPARHAIDVVELVLPDAHYAHYTSLAPQHVVATGQLLAQTRHHHTGVVLSVTTLAAQPPR